MTNHFAWEMAKEEYREKSRPFLRRRFELAGKAEDGNLTTEEQAEYEECGREHARLLVELIWRSKEC